MASSAGSPPRRAWARSRLSGAFIAALRERLRAVGRWPKRDEWNDVTGEHVDQWAAGLKRVRSGARSIFDTIATLIPDDDPVWRSLGVEKATAWERLRELQEMDDDRLPPGTELELAVDDLPARLAKDGSLFAESGLVDVVVLGANDAGVFFLGERLLRVREATPATPARTAGDAASPGWSSSSAGGGATMVPPPWGSARSELWACHVPLSVAGTKAEVLDAGGPQVTGELAGVPHAGLAWELAALRVPSEALREPRRLFLDGMLVRLPQDVSAAPGTRRLSSLATARSADLEPRSRNEVENVLGALLSVGRYLLGLHTRGRMHGGVCEEIVLFRSVGGQWRDVVVVGAGTPTDDAGQFERDIQDFRSMSMRLLGTSTDNDTVARARQALHAALDALPPHDRLRQVNRELEAALALHRQWLRPVEPMRPTAERRAVIADDGLASQLFTLLELAPHDAIRAQCEAYLKPLLSEPSTPAEASKRLREGHGRSAKRFLREWLRMRAKKKTLQPRRIAAVVRALRVYAGLLCPRDEDYDEALRVLDVWERKAQQFPPAEGQMVRFWTGVLRLKNQIHHGGMQPPPPVPSLPEGPPSDVRRATGWRVSHELLRRLAVGDAFDDHDIESSRKLIYGHASYEACFGGLVVGRAVLSRALANGLHASTGKPRTYTDRVADFRLAMQLFTMSATLATVRGLPHEYAAALAIISDAVRRAFRGGSENELRAALTWRGADADECLPLAAECALRAAEIYEWIDVPGRAWRGYLAAAETLFEAESPEIVQEGFVWIAYARALRTTAPSAAGEERLRAEEKVFERGVKRYTGAARRQLRGFALRDPGCALADDFYTTWGPTLSRAFGCSGVTIEIASDFVKSACTSPSAPKSPSAILERPDRRSAAKTGSGEVGVLQDRERSFSPASPRRSPTLERLWEMAAARLMDASLDRCRLLDLGCGTGDDLELLARRFSRMQLVGVDSSAFACESAQRRLGSTARIRRGDLTQLSAADVGRMFDVVVLRDSLMHVTDKMSVLRLARECLRPGGVVVGSDWVLLRPPDHERKPGMPVAPRVRYAAACRAAWLPELCLPGHYRKMLEAVGFTDVTGDDDKNVDDASHAMHAFFEERWTRLADDIGELPSSVDATWARTQMLGTLEAFRDLSRPRKHGGPGMLGWIFFAAVNPGRG